MAEEVTEQLEEFEQENLADQPNLTPQEVLEIIKQPGFLDLLYLGGLVETVTTVPTHIPTRFEQQIKLYVDSVTSPTLKILYLYSNQANSWIPIYAIPSVSGNSGKFLTTNGTILSWGTVSGNFEAGVVADFSTTSTGNSDVQVTFGTGTFTPTFIKLYYFIQGYNASGAGGYVGKKGIAVYNNGTLALDFPLWYADDQVERLTGDNGTIGGSGNLSNVISTFVNLPNNNAAPTVGGPVGGGDSTIVTFSILTTFAGGFTIRRTTTVGTPSAGPFTGRYKFAYEAYA